MLAMESDEDRPTLPADTLAILQEFYQEQAEKASCEAGATDTHTSSASGGAGLREMPEEDWQLSQFWYNDYTATMLAREALAVAGDHGKIACISCPTLYQKLCELKPDTCQAVVFEYDNRFRSFGQDFVFYDYNTPLDLPQQWQKFFDIVVADPPFLAEECLLKTAQTVRYLAKQKVLLCTGAIMEDAAAKLLHTTVCQFKPQHSRNLANEFRCYTNYKTVVLDAPSDSKVHF